MKRKRSEAQSDMCNPAEWIRQDEWPVGIRNVGNTCWFSAVIQVRASSRNMMNARLDKACIDPQRGNKVVVAAGEQT